MIAAKTCRQLLSYSPSSGKLTWLHRCAASPLFSHLSEKRIEYWNSRWAGKEAFTATQGQGYLVGSVMGRPLRAHRVAWAIYYGDWPEGHIDHINHDRTDNRITNLRLVDRSMNMRNQKMPCVNTTGVIGVSWIADRNKWRAQIYCGGSSTHLGYFNEIEEAKAARKKAEKSFAYHPNHGK